MPIFIGDCEWFSDGDVVQDVKYLHCACFKELQRSTTREFLQEGTGLKEFLMQDDLTLVGHNWVNADMEVLRRLFNIDFTVQPDTVLSKRIRFIDTLTMSRRLNPDRQLPKGCPKSVYNPVQGKNNIIGPHSLMAWSYKLLGEKPVVHDWRDQPIEVYLERCRADVLLTEQLYLHLLEEMR